MNKNKKRSFFYSSLIIIFFLTISFFITQVEIVESEKPVFLAFENNLSENKIVRWAHPTNQLEGRIYLDENGVALYDYQTVKGEYIGFQRNPVIIYRVANEFYNDFLENTNETSKKFFMNSVNWLSENTVKHANYSIFEFTYPNINYQLPIGWHDAMSQGRIINLMLKAHNLTNDEKFLEEAKLLSNAYFIDISDGGLTYKTKNNGWWYEHYAHKNGLHPRVLNGMMFTMQDIHSLYKYTNDTDAKFLFDQGIIALKNEIPIYDFYGYTYYDALKGSTNYNYQTIHVQKSKWLHDITNEEIFLEYHNKWKSCTELCHYILKNFALFLRETEELLFVNLYAYLSYYAVSLQ